MERITLDLDQRTAVERMVNEPTRAALNASQYGTGKTVVTVEVAQRVAPDGVKLIVAPLFTKYGWMKTILAQYPEADVKFINTTKAGKNNLDLLLMGHPGWYIIGREYFAARSVREQLAGKPSEVIDFLAYDECAAWANRKSIGFQYMMKVKPGYRMALSATPYANKFQNMWSIARWLWPDKTPRSFWKWAAEWCKMEEQYLGSRVVTLITGEKEGKSFVDTLPCYVRLEKDFGEPIEDTIEIDLSPKERRIYDEFEKYLIVWLGENPLVVKFPITKRMRLRQMTLGEVAVDPDTQEVYFPEDMKSTKYDTLVQYLGEHPDEPAIIFTDSQKYAAVVTYKLIENGYKAMEWSGRVPEDIRHEIKDAFVEDRGIDYIVATIPSIGEGVDGLQHRARTMIWLSRSDNNMLNMQAFRRLYRRGQTKQVISVDIVARNSYDEGQLSNLIEQAIRLNRSLKEGD